MRRTVTPTVRVEAAHRPTKVVDEYTIGRKASGQSSRHWVLLALFFSACGTSDITEFEVADANANVDVEPEPDVSVDAVEPLDVAAEPDAPAADDARTQCKWFEPQEFDFGEVVVGETYRTTILFRSCHRDEKIGVVTAFFDSAGREDFGLFSFPADSPPAPPELAPGESFSVAVELRPVSAMRGVRADLVLKLYIPPERTASEWNGYTQQTMILRAGPVIDPPGE